jgi:hypothetical protein
MLVGQTKSFPRSGAKQTFFHYNTNVKWMVNCLKTQIFIRTLKHFRAHGGCFRPAFLKLSQTTRSFGLQCDTSCATFQWLGFRLKLRVFAQYNRMIQSIYVISCVGNLNIRNISSSNTRISHRRMNTACRKYTQIKSPNFIMTMWRSESLTENYPPLFPY